MMTEKDIIIVDDLELNETLTAEEQQAMQRVWFAPEPTLLKPHIKETLCHILHPRKSAVALTKKRSNTMNGDELSWSTVQNLTDLIELNLKDLHSTEHDNDPPVHVLNFLKLRISQLRKIRAMVEDISVGYPEQQE